MTLGNRYNLSFRDIVTVCRNNLRLVCLWQLADSSNFIKFWQFYYLSETFIICYTECQVRVLRNTKLSYSLLPKNYYWKSCSSCQRKWSFCFCRWGNWLCFERTNGSNPQYCWWIRKFSWMQEGLDRCRIISDN